MFPFLRKTKIRVFGSRLGTCIAGSILLTTAVAQSPRPSAAQRATASGYRPEGTLEQIMKGILFQNANVVFAAQNTNPADMPPAKDPSVATDPLANSYGKWQAVENSGIAIADAANLLLIPGRKCSNGRDVPLANADWPKLVQGVREAGLKVYAAAQTKDQQKIIDAADAMTTACSDCHDKYREKPTRADRCR